MLMQKNEQERVSKANRLDALLSEAEQSEKKIAAIDELIDHIEVGERTVVDGQRRRDINTGKWG